MARIYRLLVDAYEYAYFDSKIREFVYNCNEEDSRYIKDFWDSWEDTAKNAYIEIDNIDRLVCDRFPTEVAKHMKDMPNKRVYDDLKSSGNSYWNNLNVDVKRRLDLR